MPQRKKATTKKGMKKSINGLWKSLQKEKASHVRATKRVDYLRQATETQAMVMEKMVHEIHHLEHRIDAQTTKEDNVAEFTADLVSRLT